MHLNHKLPSKTSKTSKKIHTNCLKTSILRSKPLPLTQSTRSHSGCGTSKNDSSSPSASSPTVSTSTIQRELTPSLLKPRTKQAKFMATAPDITKDQRGIFILLEGLDRSGKTTHAKHLVETLQNQFNIPAKYYPFPNRNTDTGKTINAFLQNQIELDDKQIHHLFTENRIEVQDELRKTLSSGISIVADRYAYSGAAFSAAKAIEGMDIHWCFSAEVGLPAPDIVVYMNVSPDVAKKRGGYGQERYEKEEFQAKVRCEFDTIISLSPSFDEISQQFKQQTTQQSNNLISQEEFNSTKPQQITTKTSSYLAPWYKICSDDEFEDVAQRVQFIALKALELQKSQPIHTISQFPLSTTTSNLEDDFPKF